MEVPEIKREKANQLLPEIHSTKYQESEPSLSVDFDTKIGEIKCYKAYKS